MLEAHSLGRNADWIYQSSSAESLYRKRFKKIVTSARLIVGVAFLQNMKYSKMDETLIYALL